MIPKRRFRPFSSIASAHAFDKILPTRIQVMGDVFVADRSSRITGGQPSSELTPFNPVVAADRPGMRVWIGEGVNQAHDWEAPRFPETPGRVNWYGEKERRGEGVPSCDSECATCCSWVWLWAPRRRWARA